VFKSNIFEIKNHIRLRGAGKGIYLFPQDVWILNTSSVVFRDATVIFNASVYVEGTLFQDSGASIDVEDTLWMQSGSSLRISFDSGIGFAFSQLTTRNFNRAGTLYVYLRDDIVVDFTPVIEVDGVIKDDFDRIRVVDQVFSGCYGILTQNNDIVLTNECQDTPTISSPTQAPTSTPSAGGFFADYPRWMIYGAVAAAGLLVIIAIIVVVVTSRRPYQSVSGELLDAADDERRLISQ